MTLIDEMILGETKCLEFKETLSKDSRKWVKTIVAFANSAGGKLIVGVTDERCVVGLAKNTDIFKLQDSIINTITDMCEPLIVPTISILSVEDKQLLVIEVFPGNMSPYYIASDGKDNGCYIRVGATTRQIDKDTLKELELHGERMYYDELPQRNFVVTTEMIEHLCSDLSKRARKAISVTDLVNWKILKVTNDSYTATKAFTLLVGKHDNWCSRIQCARFKGISRTFFTDKKEFEGPVYEQIDKAYQFVLDHINLRVTFEGIYRRENLEIPPDAIREAITNAVTHRNYMLPSSIQVAVFDDRVEISSPGMLFGQLTLENALSGQSALRNRTLAHVFEKTHIIEGWGTGLKRIVDLCEAEGLRAPTFTEVGVLFRIEFWRATRESVDITRESVGTTRESVGTTRESVGTTRESVGTTAGKILILLSKNPSLTRKALAEQLGLTIDGITWNINQLKRAGYIRHEGASKKGYWKILKSE